MNTDRAGKKGTHWWSFLEISFKEQIFLFDSFGFIRLKEFIIDNDRETIDKFFYGLEKINKIDKKNNLTYVQFDLIEYYKIDKSKLTKQRPHKTFSIRYMNLDTFTIDNYGFYG